MERSSSQSPTQSSSQSPSQSPPQSSSYAYRRFVSSQIISMLGSEIVGFVLGLYLAEQYENAMLFAISMILQFLPRVLISPIAGVWADKKNRKTIVIVSDAFQALVTSLLVILFNLNTQFQWTIWGTLEIWIIMGFIATRAILQAIQGPSISSILPSITPKEKLSKINAIYQFASGIAGIVAPILAAFLLSYWEVYNLLWIDAITFLLALVIIFTVQIPLHPQKPKPKLNTNISSDPSKPMHRLRKFTQDFFAGISITKEIQGLSAFLILFLLTNFLVTPVNTLSTLLILVFHEGNVNDLTFINVCFSLGLIMGSITAMLIKKWTRYIPMMLISIIGLFIGLFIVGIANKGNFWLIGIGGFITTFGIPVFSTIASTVIQLIIPLEKMGRFSGFMSALIAIFTPIGYLLSGFLGEIVQIPVVLMGASVIAIGAILLLWSFSPILQLEELVQAKLKGVTEKTVAVAEQVES